MRPRRGEDPWDYVRIETPYGSVEWWEHYAGYRGRGRFNGRAVSDPYLRKLLDEVGYPPIAHAWDPEPP